MKKLLLLVFCCFSFVLANAQSMTGYYSTSKSESGGVLSGSTPSYIKGNCTLYLNAPYLANIVKHEWLLRSGAPSGSYIQTTNNQYVTAIVGNSSYGWVVLDYTATDSSGKKYYGNYYFCVQGL